MDYIHRSYCLAFAYLFDSGVFVMIGIELEIVQNYEKKQQKKINKMNGR